MNARQVFLIVLRIVIGNKIQVANHGPRIMCQSTLRASTPLPEPEPRPVCSCAPALREEAAALVALEPAPHALGLLVPYGLDQALLPHGAG